MITRSLLLSYLEECASVFGAHIPTISKGVGVFLLVAPFGAYFVFPALDLAHLLVHTAVVGPFSAAVIYGGYWLERSGVSSHRWPRVAKWFFGGLLGFVVLNVLMMTLWGNSTFYNLMWGLFAANIGSTAGLGLGIFEARTIEQAQLAERRRLRQEAAQRRSQQFENFAKIVSHDLRNPLNVAWGHLDLARDDGDSVHLSAIRDALGRMDEIIEDVQMLTWSGQNIRGEDRELQRLGDVARTSWSYVEVDSARLQIEDNLTACANHARLQRVLENLFRNAVEHGGPEVIVRVGALSTGFFVEDDGPGIAHEKRTMVFDPGYSSGEKGTGLGLSIVKMIAEAHEWSVSVTTGRQGGARFEFRNVTQTQCNGQPRPPERDAESQSSAESTGRLEDPNNR